MKSQVREVDARGRPLPARLRLVLDTFGSSRDGESFVVRTDANPRPIYDGLRARHPDTFGWSVVSTAPPEWEIEIVRLKPKEEEKEISAYFERDHEEIDVLFDHLWSDLEDAAEHPPGGSWLLDAFDEFDGRLDLHIRWEEEILFPEAEARLSELAGGPGRIMREEHERIRALKEAARSRLAGSGRETAALRSVLEALGEMRRILIDHNLKEEAVYYPVSDDLFSPAETADLLRRVRALALGGAR